MAKALPLWKAFWLLCLPVAVLYQFAWGAAFRFCASRDWFPELAGTLVTVKLSSELLLYALMLWYLWSRTTASYWQGRALAATVMAVMMVSAAVGLGSQ